MKRKIIALCLIVAMLGVAVVGSTLAYFTDTAEATNVFTVGKIDIDLIEEVDVLSSTGKSLAADKLVYDETGATYKNIMPTNYLKKEVTVTNLENPAYVRITVVHNNYDKVNSAIDDVYEPGKKEGADWVTYQEDYNNVFDGWNIDVDAHLDANGNRYDTKYKMDTTAFDLEDGVTLLAIDMSYIPSATAENGIFSVDNWFKSVAEENSHDWSTDKSEGGHAAGYYTSVLNPGERVYVYYLKMDKGTSFKVFDGLRCPADFSEAQAEMFQDLKIQVYVDAIQAESFEADAKKAFEALNATHSLGDVLGREQNGAIVGLGDVVQVNTAADLQSALDAATGTTSIVLGDDIVGNVTATQKPDVKVIIDGNGKSFDGAITVDGGSARHETAAITIKNVNFKADKTTFPKDTAFVNLGGNNNIRYTHGVTVSNCTFDAVEAKKWEIVAIKSYTGGDWNLTVEDCEVSANVHSLLQVANVEKNLVVSGCEINSKNGINLNNTPSAVISDCTFAVQGYALRVGSSGTGGAGKTFLVKDSTLKSACAESGDAVIEVRGNATAATITLENTTLNGTTEMKGNTADTIIIKK